MLLRNSPRNRAHRLEIALGRDGKAGFDDVHAQLSSCRANRSFSAGIHGKAGRLLAVAQRGIEDSTLSINVPPCIAAALPSAALATPCAHPSTAP